MYTRVYSKRKIGGIFSFEIPSPNMYLLINTPVSSGNVKLDKLRRKTKANYDEDK